MFFPLALTALLAATAPVPLLAGPPWISIELPGNPWNSETRDAFLLVHAFHHGTAVDAPLTGTAEGLVDGRRRSLPLRFERTDRPGVYALRNQWGTRGRWVLVLTVAQHEDDVAQAVVEISEGGAVSAVRVPTRPGREGNFPRRVTAAEIEAALQGGRRS